MGDSFFKNDTTEKPSGDIPHLEDNLSQAKPEGNDSTAGAAMDEGRLGAILSYLPFLCFIPLLNMKDNREVLFHARQGVILFLIELVAVIFLIDGISDFIFKVILIAALAFSVAGVYFAFQGKKRKFPVIGDIAEKTKL